MKGLELCACFYMEVVAPLIEKHLPCLRDRYAAGLIGYGSDVLGFDDELSRDHEWGPRGQIWLRPQDYRRYAARLDRLFDQYIPGKYLGYRARYVIDHAIQCLIPAPDTERGMYHLGITSVPRFQRLQLGIRKLPLGSLDWLCLPEQKLLEITRGSIFTDPVGEITQLRQALAYFPDPVWRMKMLYTWESIDELLDVVPLNLQRGDKLMAKINLGWMTERILRLVFLLNRRYCPGSPKWMEREFRLLPRAANEIDPRLEACLAIPALPQLNLYLEEIFQILVREHNRLAITSQVSLGAPRFGRGLVSFDLSNVTDALRESLIPEMSALEIHGGLDQWVNNPDLLIWPEQYMKFKSVFLNKSHLRRDGVGDRII